MLIAAALLAPGRSAAQCTNEKIDPADVGRAMSCDTANWGLAVTEFMGVVTWTMSFRCVVCALLIGCGTGYVTGYRVGRIWLLVERRRQGENDPPDNTDNLPDRVEIKRDINLGPISLAAEQAGMTPAEYAEMLGTQQPQNRRAAMNAAASRLLYCCKCSSFQTAVLMRIQQRQGRRAATNAVASRPPYCWG